MLLHLDKIIGSLWYKDADELWREMNSGYHQTLFADSRGCHSVSGDRNFLCRMIFFFSYMVLKK